MLTNRKGNSVGKRVFIDISIPFLAPFADSFGKRIMKISVKAKNTQSETVINFDFFCIFSPRLFICILF